MTNVQYWIDTAFACGYISAEAREDMDLKCEYIGRMFATMLAPSENSSVTPLCRRLSVVHPPS